MIGYVCVLSTDDYLEGCLVLNENLRHLGSKYDLLCLINEDISKLTFHNQDLNFIEGKDPKFIPIKESLWFRDLFLYNRL